MKMEIKLGWVHTLQFRSGGDFMYKFRNNVRVGVGFFHISNAGLVIETLVRSKLIFKYQIPF